MPEISPDDLKNMSPEQIAELQKQNCIFCHIASGKVASKKVFEDEKCVGVLDINPANPGHVLLMPKEHYAIMPMMPDDIIGHMFMVAKAISHACLRAFRVQGTNIFVANGVAAGQKAQHFMIHIIPRKEGDGVSSFAMPKKKVTEEQLKEIEKALRQRINYVFGIKDNEPIVLGKPAEEKEEPEKEEKKEEKREYEDVKPAKKDVPQKKDSDKKESGDEEVEAEIIEEEKTKKKEDDEDEKETKSEIDLDKIARLLGGNLGLK